MDEQELELWRMVDVPGYLGFKVVFGTHIEYVQDAIETETTDFQEGWEDIKNEYRKINERYQKIDLSLLDDRFPLTIMERIKTKILPEMGVRYDSLDSLLNDYLSSPEATEKEPILTKIQECKDITKQFLELGSEFAENKGYKEYRRIVKGDRPYLE